MKTIHASILFALIATLLAAAPSAASDQIGGHGWKKGRETGFPIPRFVSLRSQKANMRVGPSTDHPTSWVYSKPGIPLEITEEYGNWRRVRDQHGVTGWMLAALLSSRRTAVVGPWTAEPVALRASSSARGRVVAKLSPEVRLNVRSCDGTWCEVSVQERRMSGFIDQSSLWGVYPGERFD